MRLCRPTCDADLDEREGAWARVRSSERQFERGSFTVWRCPRCRCIHAFDAVGLDRYYRHYGLHETGLGGRASGSPAPLRSRRERSPGTSGVVIARLAEGATLDKAQELFKVPSPTPMDPDP